MRLRRVATAVFALNVSHRASEALAFVFRSDNRREDSATVHPMDEDLSMGSQRRKSWCSCFPALAIERNRKDGARKFAGEICVPSFEAIRAAP